MGRSRLTNGPSQLRQEPHLRHVPRSFLDEGAEAQWNVTRAEHQRKA